MPKTDRKKLGQEWGEILKNHPRFASTFLAQQVILIQAAEIGDVQIGGQMCLLQRLGFPILFEDYWVTRCKGQALPAEIGGVIGCLTEHMNRDPAGCFNTRDEIEWFDDPIAAGRILPELPHLPGPPNPPMVLKRRKR